MVRAVGHALESDVPRSLIPTSSVPTEEHVRRFQRIPAPYRLNDLQDVDWISEEAAGLKGVFFRDIPGLKLSSIRQKHDSASIGGILSRMQMPEVDRILGFAIKYHAEDELFLIFDNVVRRQPLSTPFVTEWIEKYPQLTFALLRVFPPSEDGLLPDDLVVVTHAIVRNIIRSANDTRIAALVALEKVAKSIGMMDLKQYIDLLMLTALSVRAKDLVQEVLLVLNDSRLQHCPDSPAAAYGHKHALGVAFDRAEEAADECPCNEDGRPRKKQRVAPAHAKLKFGPDYLTSGEVIATTRIDARSSVRLHSHVRLQAASKAENRWIDAPIMDGVVTHSFKGELKINLLHPAPPEMEVMDWNMYDAGSIGKGHHLKPHEKFDNHCILATSNAMMDALQRLLLEREESCAFYGLITGTGSLPTPSDEDEIPAENEANSTPEGLNESQVVAMKSWRSSLSLIWGPPGTSSN